MVKGKHKHSKETIKKTIEGRRRNHKEWFTKKARENISNALTGRKLSEEHKKNIKEARKKLFQENKLKITGSASKKGKEHYNYIDGRSKLVSPARYGDDWEAIRSLVYLRDNFTCQECGITSKENKRALDVHHKISFLISFDNSISNLVTLCRKCHMSIEKENKNKMREEKICNMKKIS